MKIATKVSHLVWCSFWTYMVFWAFHPSPTFMRRHPFEIVFLLAAIAWLAFALALFFERPWSWYGSVIFTICSLLATIYIVWHTVAAVPGSLGVGLVLELIGASLLPIALLAALLHTRNYFLRYGRAI